MSSKPHMRSVSSPAWSKTKVSLPVTDPPGLTIRDTEAAYAEIEARELSDVEVDTPGGDVTARIYSQQSHKRTLELENTERLKRKKRREETIDRYIKRFNLGTSNPIMDSDDIAVASAPKSSPPIDSLDSAGTAKQSFTIVDNGALSLSLPDPPSKRARLSAEHPVFAGPSNNDADLPRDLEDFGFSKGQVKDMMSEKEPSWDPATPAHLLAEERGAKATREKRERVKKNGSNGAEKRYEPLFLTEGSTWALFDPNEGFPPHLGNPPPIFSRFATFTPGNTRILEYNVLSQSVRLKSTPLFLQPGKGKGIDYTKTGPRIVDVVVKRPRGRPRKHPLPVSSLANAGPKIERPTGTKTGRPVGRPRKSKVPESEESGVNVRKDESESSLTDFEVENEDEGADSEIKVKVKKEEQDVFEIRSSEDETIA